MKNNQTNQPSERRKFLSILATGAAALGLSALATPFKLDAQQQKPSAAKAPAAKSPGHSGNAADQWFATIKGTHRVVYDSPRPNEVMPFAWSKVFLLTNAASGTPEKDCGVVVVLRHDSICYAFKDRMWEKYKFVDVFKAGDLGPAFQAADAASAAKTRNPFYNTQPGDFKIPGFGAVPIGIKDLQASGVMFCVCHAAMTVFSAVIADKMSMKQEEVMNEWKSELIPGIQVVPSGVWALGRAQEHGCKYIYAG